MLMKTNDLSKKLIAECLGTFILTLVVLVSVNNKDFPIPTPIIAAATLGFFVITIGKISGCHINPAITVALAFLKKITPNEAVLYIFVQIIGALLARVIASIFIPNLGVLIVQTNITTTLAEIIGAGMLGYGVGSVVFKNVQENLAGVVIGTALFLGIEIAAIGSNAILNPAVAAGIGSAGIAYLLGPVLGASVGMMTAHYFATEK